uniref:Amiloride-sensitive sodium channel n=1 Tax=Macrostomum lignano TaxID=282301 RepID=A0A1I8GS74_9PLAT
PLSVRQKLGLCSCRAQCGVGKADCFIYDAGPVAAAAVVKCFFPAEPDLGPYNNNKEPLKQFCSSTSLRGAGRLVKAPTRHLRAIWAGYLCLMAAALIACVCFIAKDYLQYKTIIQTTIVLNDPTIAIPAVTVCNHYPFSKTAATLWSSGQVLSPTNFSHELRRTAFQLFNSSEFLMAENVLASDTKKVYYQSLEHNDAVNLSFSVPQLFIFCVTGVGPFVEISNWKDCSLLLKRVSLPSYFNCYQVQAPRDIDWLTLVLRVSSAVPNEYEEAFVQDIFEQADGIRLEVHENDTYPEPTLKGIHVEPGKLVEISYKTERWAEVDSPADACMSAEAASQRKIRDLDEEFAYSYEACLRQELGKLALERCGCHYVKYLRSSVPNGSHPYCGDTRIGMRKMLANIDCLNRLNLDSERERLSRSVCLMPCHFHYFDTVASKTVWRATQWQLHWLMQHSRCFRDLDEASKRLEMGGLPPDEERRLREKLEQASVTMKTFFETANITKAASADGGTNGFDESAEEKQQTLDQVMPKDDTNFAYVTIRRQSRNTVQKTEILSLGLSALMSQIGGLSSLFLGLTCAVAVELLELCLLRRYQSNQKRKENQQQLPQQVL